MLLEMVRQLPFFLGTAFIGILSAHIEVWIRIMIMKWRLDTKRRPQYGNIFFDLIDQCYYYDEGIHLRFVRWGTEREAAPMHQSYDEVEARNPFFIPLPHYQRDFEAGSPMHQKVIVEPWQKVIYYDECSHCKQQTDTGKLKYGLCPRCNERLMSL